jgi:hypothetical protein
MDQTIPQSPLNSPPGIATLAGSETKHMEKLLNQYHERILKLTQEIHKALNLALNSFHAIDPRIQPRLLIRLRSEATNKLDSLKMPQERKDYLLHQLVNCHDIESFIDLIREVNHSQMSVLPILTVKNYQSVTSTDFNIQKVGQSNDYELDLLVLIHSQQGLLLGKQKFSHLAGHLESIPLIWPEVEMQKNPLTHLKIQDQAVYIQIKNLPDSFHLKENREGRIEFLQNMLSDFSKMGVKVVGLDETCLKLTENGTRLDPKGLIISTGSTLFGGLIQQKAIQLLQQKRIPQLSSTLGVAGGLNQALLLSTLLLADQIKRIIIFHHTPIELSPKLQQNLTKLLNDISRSQEESPVVEIVRHFWQENMNLMSFLAQPLVKRVLVVTTDLTMIEEVDLLLTTTSPVTQLIQEEVIKRCPAHINISANVSVSNHHSSLNIAEAETILLSQIVQSRPEFRLYKKESILNLHRQAQLHGFQLNL